MLQLSGSLVHRPPQQEDVQSTQELFRGGMPKETCTFRKATDESNEQFSSIRIVFVSFIAFMEDMFFATQHLWPFDVLTLCKR